MTITVSAFMGGLVCGSFAGGHLADRLSLARCLVAFAGAELAVAAFAIVSKLYYYDFPYTRLGVYEMSMPLLAAVLFASVVWPTFFMGLSLPLFARGATGAIEAAARTVGSLYGWNTLGTAAGALCTTWLLLRRFDFESCLLVGAALNATCAASVVPLRRALLPAGAPVDAAGVPLAAEPWGVRRPAGLRRGGLARALRALRRDRALVRDRLVPGAGRHAQVDELRSGRSSPSSCSASGAEASWGRGASSAASRARPSASCCCRRGSPSRRASRWRCSSMASVA